MANSTHSTPKRKHAELHNNFVPNLNTTTQFNDFTFALGSPESGGAESPRTNVARRFHGLAIGGGSGGGVDSSNGSSPTASSTNSPEVKGNRSVFLSMALQDEELDGSRKRLKLPGAALPVSETTPMHSPGKMRNHKPRSRARAGTPPLTYRPSASPDPDAASSPFVTDALRASLTWHDNEITIYDPEDSEDDGTGINGIGFKPTPAVAYARTERRRQQLAEYRKREEREARAKRSQRRRGSPVPGLVELKGSMERRRVRFMESATELISF
ncbi:hypothetical protein B0T18DRAFT_437469 [Schizothecium vesticola]|uniref:Uncharacterized protein n=1 Tax=Schizothecium vesticola TaxID=314040 RepID=A0AA40F316_9PEZI|nr:hypothetical protein B0T18DRAFT_437469 [Schizothecium vesticola]